MYRVTVESFTEKLEIVGAVVSASACLTISTVDINESDPEELLALIKTVSKWVPVL